MRVTVTGRCPRATLLGALLSAMGNEVCFPHIGGPSPMRFLGPAGWQELQSYGTPQTAGADLMIVSEDGPGVTEKPASVQEVPELRVCAGLLGEAPAGDACVPLYDALYLGDDTVELASAGSVLLMSRGAGPLGAFARHMGSLGLRVRAVSRLDGARQAWFAARLLELPASLCNCTLGAFLSSPEGRRVADAVLVEGLKVIERGGGRLDRLPIRDPVALLGVIRGRTDALAARRSLPDRAYPPLLQALLRGASPDGWVVQSRLLRRASELGVAADWNWRLMSLLPRVRRRGFFASAAELLRAAA